MITLLVALMIGSTTTPSIVGQSGLAGNDIRRGQEIAKLCMEHEGQAACLGRVAEDNRRDTRVGCAAFEVGLFATAYRDQSLTTEALLEGSNQPQAIDESLDREAVYRHDYQRSRERVGLTNWQIVGELRLPKNERHAAAAILSRR